MVSAGCAPEIPYRRSMTKKGTPVTPSEWATCLVGLDGLRVLVTGQDGQRLVTVQAHVGRETGE